MARPRKVKQVVVAPKGVIESEDLGDSIFEVAKQSPSFTSTSDEIKPHKYVSKAQDLASRIWEGQSPDVSVIDRVARIAAGLKAQNMSLDIELPHPDAGRYLEAHR